MSGKRASKRSKGRGYKKSEAYPVVGKIGRPKSPNTFEFNVGKGKNKKKITAGLLGGGRVVVFEKGKRPRSATPEEREAYWAERKRRIDKGLLFP